ncbi:MAG: glucosidase, partial [Candidatus Eisenbacteria bacterium]
ECYYYLDATPSHSYLKALYKYPHAEFPYERLLEENGGRGKDVPEYEIVDTGVFDQNRYFDVQAEYAKRSPDCILIRITVSNRGPDSATLHLLPQLWFRNTWSWGREGEGYWPRPNIESPGNGTLVAEHVTLGRWKMEVEPLPGQPVEFIFTENDTNTEKLFGDENDAPYVKDAFHEYVVGGRTEAVNPSRHGTKAAAVMRLRLAAGETIVLRMLLYADDGKQFCPFDKEFDWVFEQRIREADQFYAGRIAAGRRQERRVARQAYAGLLWSKQFYHYIQKHWIEGDPAQPPPPDARLRGRNAEWQHIYNRDIISMPDKWEYPWYAAWDLAFHMIPFAKIDPHFAKEQLVLFLREWYLHPNGQLPAYELVLGDVNPPVHAWACWRVYKMSGVRGERDRVFLSRVFQKLLLNFTWWVNRKDAEGKNLFSGGFLGLDNIGVFDRSRPAPTGGHLEQADGTAWMAFYCATMLSIALELSKENPATEDLASKFFEHFIAISDAMNYLGGTGLWDEEDGFYYDRLHTNGREIPLKVRSMVGLLPLIACEVLQQEALDRLPGFSKRLNWFLENRPDLAGKISIMSKKDEGGSTLRLLAIPSRERLLRVLRYMLDEKEFLSPHGIRSVSAVHDEHPYVFEANGERYDVSYVPGESATGLFGGNSNWRGPIWFPVNYLLVEALERYHHFYGDSLKVECPVGSGRMMNLKEVAQEISARLASIFLPDEGGHRPCHGGDARYAGDLHFRDLVLFHEYFHGDNGRGMGASHQTGWTALVTRLIDNLVQSRGSGVRAGTVRAGDARAGAAAAGGVVSPAAAPAHAATAAPPAVDTRSAS